MNCVATVSAINDDKVAILKVTSPHGIVQEMAVPYLPSMKYDFEAAVADCSAREIELVYAALGDTNKRALIAVSMQIVMNAKRVLSAAEEIIRGKK